MTFQCISIQEAKSMLDAEGASVVDIRDQTSFSQGHISGSFHLHSGNVDQYIAEADLDKPLIVCCYHGHSSQGTAGYLANQGFDQVFSLDGGFEAWKGAFEFASL